MLRIARRQLTALDLLHEAAHNVFERAGPQQKPFGRAEA
jgi:hypothetical protein